MTSSFEAPTLKERLIHIIEQADDVSNEISVVHEQLSELAEYIEDYFTVK